MYLSKSKQKDAVAQIAVEVATEWGIASRGNTDNVGNFHANFTDIEDPEDADEKCVHVCLILYLIIVASCRLKKKIKMLISHRYLWSTHPHCPLMIQERLDQKLQKL